MLSDPFVAQRTDLEITTPEAGAGDERSRRHASNDHRQDDPTHARTSTPASFRCSDEQGRPMRASWASLRLTSARGQLTLRAEPIGNRVRNASVSLKG